MYLAQKVMWESEGNMGSTVWRKGERVTWK